jgi:signal transduction histidine kinase
VDRWLAGVAAGLVALAVAAEAALFDPAEVTRWAPDMAVGLVAGGAGLWALTHHRRAGWLLVAVAATWFLGNLVPTLVFLHRGVLVHALAVWPGVWTSSGRRRTVIAAAYGGSATTILWSHPPASAAAALLLGVACLWSAHRVAGLVLAAVVLLAGLGGSVVDQAWAGEGSLAAYQLAVAAVCLHLAAQLRTTTTERLTDTVVEIGGSRAGYLTTELSRALRDPSLTVGFIGADGRYVDVAGDVVAEPGNRTVTKIEVDGAPYAAIVHDPMLADEEALQEAVRQAGRLLAANARLRREHQARTREVEESRARLLLAADSERDLLEARLSEGPGRQLRELVEELDQHGETAAARYAREAIDQLTRAARGLHPRQLDEGLAAAVAGAARGSGVDVRLDVAGLTAYAELEPTVYYVCCEGLANAAKHAPGSSVSVRVTEGERRVSVEVVDDGPGGIRIRAGGGLEGLRDRVQAMGGGFQASGSGVSAWLPASRNDQHPIVTT